LAEERSITNLTQALSGFIKENEFAEPLARGMLLFLENETVAFDRLKALFGPDYVDILLLAFDWKLIIPLIPSKTCAWEDLAVSGINAPLYTMPKAVFYVLQEAMNKGIWDVDMGLKIMFETLDISVPPDKMVELVEELFNREKFMCVSARDIDIACRTVGLPGFADQVIAILKGVGIISPKLGYLGKSKPSLGPLYDVNPSLGKKLIGG
jgi:hypothetical protein